MIIDWIHRYYRYFLFFFIAVATLKVLLYILFHERINGISGIFVALFKWFTSTDLEIYDTDWQHKYLRWLNFISLFVYLSLLWLLVLELFEYLF